MHYSQMRKQSSSRKSLHPGTPRPNPENFLQPGESSPRNYSCFTKDAAVKDQDHPAFSATHQGKLFKTQQRLSKQQNGEQNSPVNSNESLPNYLVWVKNEPFDFGILSQLPCPKIGINILRKIAEYCREKPGHFPELSLNQWSHICKYKMQLATDLCFTYFHVFDVVTRPNSTWTQHHSHMTLDGEDGGKANVGESWDVKFHRMVKQGHDFNDEFKVDTMQFLLFLYIQHFLRLHKKYFLKSYGDEPWPKAWVSSLIQRSNGAGTGANVPEQQQAEFIMANLSEIIDFLMLLHETHHSKKSRNETEGKSESPRKEKVDSLLSSAEVQYQRIPISVIRALSLVLGVASTLPKTEFKTLDECLQLSDVRWKLEYSRYSKTVDKRSFLQWVVKNLKINPWGPSSVPIPQVPVSVISGIWDDIEYFKQNKIFWNTQNYPKSWFLISGVEKQVLVADSLEPMSSVKIHRCSNAFIYLPGVHNYVLVQKCHGITINLGVTTKVAKFIECSGITVSAVGRQFIITDVSLSSFHLLTPSSPIICGSKNHEIRLSPYNTNYPNLISQMKTAGISPKIQRWNRPMEIANDGFPRALQQSSVLPLASEQFRMFYFPFKYGGSSTNIASKAAGTNDLPLPGTLPSTYQRCVDYAAEKMHMARKDFAAKLMHSEEDSSLIYQITLQRFKKWLKESGNYEHIVGLRSYQKSLEQECSLPIVCSKGHDLSCVSKALKNFFKGEGHMIESVRSTPSISSSSHSSHHVNKQDKKISKEQKERHREAVFETYHAKTSRGAGDENKLHRDLHSSKGKYHNHSSNKSSSSVSISSVKRN